LFISIFALALFLTIKTIRNSNSSLNTKIVASIAFAALTGYFVDALFNFPGERPNIQLLFVLALAILLTNWMSLKPAKDLPASFGWVKGFSIIMLTVCAGAVYVNAMVYTSSKAQYITDNDFAAIDNIPTALPKLKFEEVKNMFPSIPNIGENSETIGYKKARYLHKEKRYAEAIKLLDSVHKQSPHIIYDDYLKCNIYLEEKKLDSAYKYGKKAF
jgi:tetratricopeptide (TPR) repeat protein